MEITIKDAVTILGWASIADNESMCYDNTNILGRIKKAFPSLIKDFEMCEFFQDKRIAEAIAFYKEHPELP